jgi:NADPH:quinone reductase-like Zn-dependent oxidoreductase
MRPTSTLRARYERRGPVPEEVIHPVECALPGVEPGQALVAVLAAPINPADLLVLTGGYGMLPPLPAFAGGEGVGRVMEVGEGPSSVRPGQLVLLPGGGTWSSHLVVEARRLVPLPEGADPLQLAMLTVNPPTAALLLSEFVALAPGDWVIQNAANSAVGGYLVQLARLQGLRTVNVVRREGAVAAVRAQGADVVLVDGDDLAERVKRLTGDAPLRLGLDAVGGSAAARLAACLSEGGTVVTYGRMSGEPCLIDAEALVFRDIRVRGFWLARWARSSTREAQVALYGALTEQMARGQLAARIHATFPVEEIQAAVAAAAGGERDGKVLIVPAT